LDVKRGEVFAAHGFRTDGCRQVGMMHVQ
jgi:hypothetical protein